MRIAAPMSTRRHIAKRVRQIIEEREHKRGLLIAFEGPEGAGKSTQRRLFRDFLKSEGVESIATKWNSSQLIGPLVSARKNARSLSPQEFSLLYAADFRHRIETEILPALWKGQTVVADRHFFTALARDCARGVDLNWLLQIYSPLFWPDIVFYFSISAETSQKRTTAKRDPNFYEAGQDVTGIADPHESYAHFMGRVIEEYQALAGLFQFVKVDGEQSIFAQHRQIREVYQKGGRHPWTERNMDALVDWLSHNPKKLKKAEARD